MSLGYLHNIMKQSPQSPQYISICLKYGPKLKIHLFMTFDLKPAPNDLKIHKLYP